MANVPGLKKSQLLTVQTGVPISRSFLRENLGASNIRKLVVDTLLSYEEKRPESRVDLTKLKTVIFLFVSLNRK